MRALQSVLCGMLCFMLFRFAPLPVITSVHALHPGVGSYFSTSFLKISNTLGALASPVAGLSGRYLGFSCAYALGFTGRPVSINDGSGTWDACDIAQTPALRAHYAAREARNSFSNISFSFLLACMETLSPMSVPNEEIDAHFLLIYGQWE